MRRGIKQEQKHIRSENKLWIGNHFEKVMRDRFEWSNHKMSLFGRGCQAWC